MSLYFKDYTIIAMGGASFTVLTSLLSSISGDKPYSVKDIVKAVLIGAGTSGVIFTIADRKDAVVVWLI